MQENQLASRRRKISMPRKDYTLVHYKTSIPEGGLMHPSLRNISVDVKHIKAMAKPKCGRFNNVLGK